MQVRRRSSSTFIARWLAAAVLSAVAAAACDDDPASTEPDVTADTADDAAEGEPDVSIDVPEPDVTEEPEVTPDIEEEEEPELCPGSLYCWDDLLDRPRASICIEAGYPPDTACNRIEDGLACCVPPFSCETNEDCEAAREEEGFCDDERFACVCNFDGSCSSFVCLVDEECEEGEVCRSGACVAPGSTDGLVARILSPDGVIAEAETRQLLAVAVDPEDPSRVFHDVPLTWGSDATARVDVDATGEATGGTEPGPAVITARVTANAEDPGDSVTLRNVAASEGGLRVIVIDEASRQPVSGAFVQVVPESGDPAVMSTGGSGVVIFGGELDTPVDISVFAPTHGYVTYVGVEASDVLFALPPVVSARVAPETEADWESPRCQTIDGESLCFDLSGLGAVLGAATGCPIPKGETACDPDDDLVANTGEIEVALTGMALGNGLLDLNFELLVGPNVLRDLSGGPIPIDEPTEIPGGFTLAFNDDPLVPSYVLTGTPGEHIVWSLGGRVSLSENPTLLPEIIEQVGGDLDIAKFIAIALPLFADFYSGIAPAVTVEAPDESSLNLSETDVRLTVPVGRRIHITAPELPTFGEDLELETGLFLAGASVPGHGFVPLGVTAATDGANDTPRERLLDGDPETPEVDDVSLNMGPIHGGIQSPETGYVLVAVAVQLEEPTGGGGTSEHTSGLIVRVTPGDVMPEHVDLSEGAFPALPEGSTWTAESRTVTVVPSDFEADFYRVLFRGEGDRPWQVYLPDDVASWVAPDPSAIDESLEDRTLRNRVSVVSIGLDADLQPAESYASLIELGGLGLDRLVDAVTAFSVFELGN